MDVGIKPPSPLDMTGDVSQNWKTFLQRYKLYLVASGLENKSGERKVALLLTVAGPTVIDVFNTLVFNDEADKKNLDTVVGKLQNYFSPKKNEVYQRYVFRCRMQKPGENFDSYITDLKLKAESCNYGDLDMRNTMVRDQVVFGTSESRVREKLLREEALTLEKTIKICIAYETTNQQMKAFNVAAGGSMAEQQGAVNAVGKKPSQKKGRARYDQPQASGKQPQQPERHDKSQRTQCSKCGTTHAYRNCPAYGRTCHRCQGKNHYMKMCTAKNIQPESGAREKTGKKDNKIGTVDDMCACLNDLFIGSVNHDVDVVTQVTDDVNKTNVRDECIRVNEVNNDKWIVPMDVNDTVIPLKLDTGAKANLITECDLKLFNKKPKVVQKDVNLTAYNGTRVESKGICRLSVRHQNVLYQCLFVVVPSGMMSLLGDRDCERLGLVKLISQVQNVGPDPCPPQNTELSALPHSYKIKLDPAATPVVHPPRRVPAALRQELKEELQNMESLGIITPVTEPTDWVNSIVIVKKKSGALRICLDPKDLNAGIKREHYPIPVKDEILSEMAGAKVFTKLDASQGFWQIKLDEESSRLTTFNTPFGRFRFLRMPFGISSAPEIFHRAMESVIEGLPGVRVYIDDIIVWGKDQAEHDVRLQKVLQRVKENNLLLNKEKCEVGKKEVVFLGERVSSTGVQPLSDRVEAIKNIAKPTCKKDIQRIFGMLNYVSKYIPHLAARNSALRMLLRENVLWTWDKRHDDEWTEIKKILSAEPVLKYFDTQLPIKVSTDASKDGLGAVLLQKHDDNWAPVAYAARSMTSAETRYSQIEKEMLGLVFGCKKFHNYIYGLPFELETDHKPLTAIIHKNLADMSPRIQRLMMKLQNYDLTLSYTPGKFLVIADALSRSKQPKSTSTSGSLDEQDVDIHVNMITSTLPASEGQLTRIAEETEKDPLLRKVINCLNERWQKGACPQYYSFQDELSYINGILMKGSRIVIPTMLRSEILQRLHDGHLGIEKTKALARTGVYWPGMCSDIETLINNCSVCIQHRYKQPKETFVPANMASTPWEKVGADLFELDGRNYLLLIDYYSNYPEVALLSSTSSNAVITHMKSIFGRHGIPFTLVTDNGPQFSSREFQKFMNDYEVTHITSSPYYAQSNGKAEKGVQIIKRLYKKSLESNSDPYLALLAYRAAPLANGYSPGELLMGRKLRGRLPQMNTQKPPRWTESHFKQKQYYDRTAHDLPELKSGNNVRLQSPEGWLTKASVQEMVGPRSYKVETDDGKVYVRNRRHLLKTSDDDGTTHEATSTVPKPHNTSRPIEQGSVPATDPQPVRRSARVVKAPSRFEPD